MNIKPINLRRGAGNGDPKNGLCLMQAVHWFSGVDHLSDHPECASPVLCEVGIRLNDTAPDQKSRDQLWPLVWQLLDSRDPDAEQRRAEHIVRGVAHRIVAPIFDKIKLPEHAAALRGADSMEGIKGAASDVAVNPARAAVARAARAAANAAWAARAAWAADAAWVADAAWAASARAAAAAAVVAASDRSPAWAAAWNEFRLIFIEAIALGKHGDGDPIYEPRALQLHRILTHAD